MPIDKLIRYGLRIARMGPHELLDRGRQALAKQSDTALARLHYSFGTTARSHSQNAPGNFFFSSESVESILALIRKRLPGRAEQIIQEAEQILQHRFNLLGYESLDYGDPSKWDIDWHRDAVHGKRAPDKQFHRIRYLDFAECGDSKVIWELNRHQHFVTLAKAFRLTNDFRYLNEIVQQKKHWHAHNPYPLGINWASSLEVAFRSLSWLWTCHVLRGSPGIPNLRQEWLPGLSLHGRHLERYLSTYSSPNTHLLGEAVGLFFLGVLCPELPAAARWKSLGWQIVLRESERQVHRDGFYFEQSTYYHVYALDFLLHAALLAEGNQIPLPQSFKATIEKMLDALLLLNRNGMLPQFGDDDGGRLLDPRRNRREHLLDPLATGAVWFRRGDFKAAAGSLREETLWLLGALGAETWDQLANTPVSKDSAALPQTGLYLLATEKSQLIVDAGPLGALTGGHGHADALSVCLESRGRSLLIDSGTSQYVGPGDDRRVFRGTGQHNTLQVDRLDQAEPASPFSWQNLTETKVEQWAQAPSLDLLVASHNGYHRLRRPVTHRRWVISLKNDAFLIRDVIEGYGKHKIDIAWHLAPDLELMEALTFRAKDHGLAFLPAQDSPWTHELQTKMWSPVYGQKSPTMAVKFTAEVTLPAEFAVMLIPFENIQRSTGTFRRQHDEQQPEISSYTYAGNDGEYSFVFNDSSRTFHSNSLSSDARFVCHKRTPSEKLIFCGGSYASVDHRPNLRCRNKVEWAELVINETCQVAICSDSAALFDDAPPPSITPTAVLGKV